MLETWNFFFTRFLCWSQPDLKEFSVRCLSFDISVPFCFSVSAFLAQKPLLWLSQNPDSLILEHTCDTQSEHKDWFIFDLNWLQPLIFSHCMWYGTENNPINNLGNHTWEFSVATFELISFKKRRNNEIGIRALWSCSELILSPPADPWWLFSVSECFLIQSHADYKQIWSDWLLPLNTLRSEYQRSGTGTGI